MKRASLATALKGLTPLAVALAAVLLAATGLIPAPAWAAIDGLEAARQQAGKTTHGHSDTLATAPRIALRWDNVAGAPYRVSGPTPLRDARHGWYAFDLQPAQKITLHLPAHAWLRVVAEPITEPDTRRDGQLDDQADAPQFALSDGTGVALERRPLAGTDGHSWLIKTELPHPTVIHVARRAGASGVQRLAFFIARVDAPAESVTYRHDVPLPPPHAMLRRADEAVTRSFSRVMPSTDWQINIDGPDRLLLEYQIDARHPAAQTRLALDVRLDGQPATQIQQLSGSDPSVPLNIDNQWHAGARLERAALAIPAGRHTLAVRSSHPLLLRAARAGEPDFLLPELNFPAAWRDVGSDTALEALEQRSIASASSNRWRDIGLLAAQVLKQEAAGRIGVAGLQAAADEMESQSGAYRDLLPVDTTVGSITSKPLSYLLQLPQAPNAPHRSQVRDSSAPTAPAALALFHAIGKQAVRFAMPQSDHPIRLRILVADPAGQPAELSLRYGDGTTANLSIGAPALAGAQLRTVGGLPAQYDQWPAGIGGYADRAGAIAPLAPVGSTEWQVPTGVTAISLRATQGFATLALQWLASSDYLPGDQLLAQLVHLTRLTQAGKQSPLPSPASRLLEDATRPLERRLAAARAQFTANVAPISPGKNSPDNSGARAEALHTQARALLEAGERYLAEKILRAHWAGEDGAPKQLAADELDKLYASEGGRAMQIQFAAARAASDRHAYSALSQALAAEGEDAMALLVGLLAPRHDVPTLLQTALRSGHWQTFDALLPTLGTGQDVAFWQAQRALSHGALEQAQHGLEESGRRDWPEALQRGRAISSALLAGARHTDDKAQAKTQAAAAVAEWLQWQASHPGPRVWQQEPGLIRQHAGAIVLRNPALSLGSNWWRASAKKPLIARIVGPARIRVEARPLHDKPDALASGWLQLRTAEQAWVQPFSQNQVAPGLRFDAEAALPGGALTREVQLPSGIHALSIDTVSADGSEMQLAVRLLIERPALQLPVLPAPAALHFEPHAAYTLTTKASGLCDAGFGAIAGTNTGTDAGASQACQLDVADGLRAQQLDVKAIKWGGLPTPPTVLDPSASRFAAGGIRGAIDASDDPAEKLRLWLWLSQKQPSERARAVAHGAALASHHPSAEMRSHWGQLETHSAWSTLTLVERSAGLRAIEVEPGTPESPGARLRAALLPPLRPGELRVSGDTRASLWMNETSATPLTIEMRIDDLPGNTTLPATALVAINGVVLHKLALSSAEAAKAARKLPLLLPAGEQKISVALRDPYANQFLSVRFTGTRQALPKLTRYWHIASPSQAVKVTMAGPAWLRIDRLERGAIQSEEKLVSDAISSLVLRVQPGATESLYRVHQRRVEPAVAASAVPRPLADATQPMPPAPEEWQIAAIPAPTAAHVHFVDALPLSGQPSATWSSRAGVYRRQDIEASGGNQAGTPERYAEAGFTWRRRSDDDSSTRLADIFVRHHLAASPAIGFKLSTEQALRWSGGWRRP